MSTSLLQAYAKMVRGEGKATYNERWASDPAGSQDAFYILLNPQATHDLKGAVTSVGLTSRVFGRTVDSQGKASDFPLQPALLIQFCGEEFSNYLLTNETTAKYPQPAR